MCHHVLLPCKRKEASKNLALLARAFSLALLKPYELEDSLLKHICLYRKGFSMLKVVIKMLNCQ